MKKVINDLPRDCYGIFERFNLTDSGYFVVRNEQAFNIKCRSPLQPVAESRIALSALSLALLQRSRFDQSQKGGGNRARRTTALSKS